MEPILLVHGGAGNIRDARVPPKIASVKAAAIKGYEVLRRGGSAVDAVEEAVKIMEDDECMNAGYGSVLNCEGDVEMDACIMNGENMDAGSVAVVKDIAHPVTLARMVMERTPYVMIAGEGTMALAKEMRLEMLPPGSLVTKDSLKALEVYKQTGGAFYEIGEAECMIVMATEHIIFSQSTIELGWKSTSVTEGLQKKFQTVGEVGTVGAVALDFAGHVAAATSTGGLNGKKPGRVGDTPLIGGGTYAKDGVGAVSATGNGEAISKWCLAHSAISAMKGGSDPQTAVDITLNQMNERLNKTAGAICISNEGKVGVGMTTKRMAWAYKKGNELIYGIDKGKQERETVSIEASQCSLG